MTPRFYARYIPPIGKTHPVKDTDYPGAPRPVTKRRRRNDNSIEDIPALEALDVNRGARSGIEGTRSDHCKVGLASEAVSKGPYDDVKAKGAPDLSRKAFGEFPTTRGKNHAHVSTAEDVEPQAHGAKKKTKTKRRNAHGGDPQTAAAKNATTACQELVPGDEGEDIDGSKHAKLLSKYQKSVTATATSTEIDGSSSNAARPSIAQPETHGLTPIPQPLQIPDAAGPSIFAALPVWLTDPVVASAAGTVTFESLALDPCISNSLKAEGYDKVFAIQAAVLPLLLPSERQHHGDLCISASTGSGKTLAYAAPIVQALRGKPTTRLRALVVVPTRELVSQAHEMLELCGRGSGLKMGTAYGNKTLREEQEVLIARQYKYDPEAYQREQEREADEDEQLLNWDSDAFDDSEQGEGELVGYKVDRTSRVDLLVCTPGRLIEHLQHTRGFTLEHVQWLVIDEADRLLDESFQQWIELVVPALEYQSPPSPSQGQMMQSYHLQPKREVRKIILSATMTTDISKLRELKLRRPKLVVLKSEHELPQPTSEAADEAPGTEPGEQVELPQTLQEAAVQIKDEENKPLYLIELLNQLPSIETPRSTTNPRTNSDRRGSITSETSESESISSTPPTSSLGSHSCSSVSDSNSNSPHAAEQQNAPTSQIHGSLIFTHSTASAHRLSRLLSILYPAQAAATATMTKSSSKLSKRILSQFRAGIITTIISTDRTSRGLDIPHLAHVINYDMPPSVSSYIHRVGRTARAGKPGTATTLVGWKEGRWFWNEIGRGSGIRRGPKKIARQIVREEDWNEEELQRYADALKQLGDETRGMH